MNAPYWDHKQHETLQKTPTYFKMSGMEIDNLYVYSGTLEAHFF